MISPAGLASPLLLLVGYVGTAVGHRESHSLFLHNKVDLNVLDIKLWSSDSFIQCVCRCDSR